MILLAFKFCVISSLLNPNQANTTITSFDKDSLPPFNKLQINNESKINNAFMYYITGGTRDENSLRYAKYMVSIRTRNPQKYFGDNHYCAGVIISEKAVLTSAHCVMDKRRVITRPRRMLIVGGTPNRLVVTKTTQQFPVKSISANTNFIRNNKEDIAIIRLKHEIPNDNENIEIIKMPTGPPSYDKKCTIIGWGRMIVKGPLAALPLHLDVRLYTPSQCKTILSEHYYDGLICAGDNSEYDEDPCHGDGGGPLICDEKLTGIIAWTLGCGSHKYPSLYTDVWHHRKWINDRINAAFRIEININLFIFLAIITICLL